MLGVYKPLYRAIGETTQSTSTSIDLAAGYRAADASGLDETGRTRTTAGGMLMAKHEPAGALKTGSFATQKPSELELKRRERVKAGDW